MSLLVPARYKGAFGGRGSGKSHLFAEMVIEAHILDQDSNTVCIREIQQTLKYSSKKLLEQKIIDLGVGHYFDVQDTAIKSRNGKGIIIFTGMMDHTAESIKSLEGFDRAWVEEAQSLSQRSIDLLRPTIRRENSEIWFTWNPRFDTDPVDVLLRGSELPPGSVVVGVNYSDNPWFPDVLRTEMEYDRERDLDKYGHVWLGGYVKNSEARVFHNWKVEEFEAPKDVMFRFGADWGFSVDPTTLIRCYTIGRNLYVDYEAYMIGCEILDTPDLFMTVPESENWPIIADSARPETISHMRKNGFPKIMKAVKGARSVEGGIEWLKSFNIIVHPRCIHLIDELVTYSFKVDKNTQKVLPVLEDKKNHIIDALRYASEGDRRAVKSVEYDPIIVIPTMHHWS
jgi:phage terminase large subunit